MNTKKMKIEKLDNFGRGITYYNDKIMFVSGALKDEEVIVKNICENKKYYEAEVEELISKSNKRIEVKCPFYYECGGCNLLHMSSDFQEYFKINKVKDILKKYANIDNDFEYIESDKFEGYRNKISLKIKDYKWGYYNDKTHNFISVDKCLLVGDAINDVIKNRELFNIKDGEIVIRCNIKGEILISIKTDNKYNISNNIPNNVIGIVVNDKIIYGDNYLYDYIGDYKFKVSYNSFFQINNYIAEKIFNILNENLMGKNVLDLYCGVGVLGIAVNNNFDKVYGLEIIENAIIDAKYNANLNKLNNYEYNVIDLKKGVETKDIFDAIIVDPPRNGLSVKTKEYLINNKVNLIGYVSCDPMTLARDIKDLSNDYFVDKVYVLNMFPQTYHVETICILKKL